MARNIPSVAYVHAIDLPGARWGNHTSEIKLVTTLRRLQREGWSADLTLLDSHAPETIELARSQAPYDFIFLDGDHTYDGVRADYENYGKMGRIIGLHDINHPADSPAYGPTRLWHELRGVVSDDYGEIIAKDSKKGIGLLF